MRASVYLAALPRPLEPPSQQFLRVPVKRRRIPMHAAKLERAIQKLESILVRCGHSVESFLGISVMLVILASFFPSSLPLKPIKPNPSAGTRGPFLPIGLVGSLAGILRGCFPLSVVIFCDDRLTSVKIRSRTRTYYLRVGTGVGLLMYARR